MTKKVDVKKWGENEVSCSSLRRNGLNTEMPEGSRGEEVNQLYTPPNSSEKDLGKKILG
jgi:hypothetical protein